MAVLIVTSAQADLLVSSNDTWRYFPGVSEASSPTDVWRHIDFDDSSWATGPAPFHFGTNRVGGDDWVTGGTILSNMRSNCTCVFLRKPFVVSNLANLVSLQLSFVIDDGLIVWLNGTQIRNAAGPVVPAYTNSATSSREAGSVFSYDVSSLGIPALQTGTNVLAVQAFNFGAANDDFRVAVWLYTDGPPQILSVSPPPGAVISNLTSITVVFDKEVTGVVAGDFLVNGNPAAAVSGAGSSFTYTFAQPLPGPVLARWDVDHTITDLAGRRFDESVDGAQFDYTLADDSPPQMARVLPVPRATVGTLTQIEVGFSEPVTGIDASDLVVNGSPATSVVPSGLTAYRFNFPAVPNGVVTVSWAANSNIRDKASNPFSGGSWNYTNNPALASGNVVINEILTENLNSIADEDGQKEDWIELWNRGTSPVRLLGWSLTDDPMDPAKWLFPDLTLGAGQYLVLFASEKDRRTTLAGTTNHTNFRLNPAGNYLGLYNASFPPEVVSEFAPEYPEQRADLSFGRLSGETNYYFSTLTPGRTNSGATAFSGFALPPHLSVPSGFFNQSFQLVLSTETPGASVYYTLDGRWPTESNQLYTGPITIAGTATKAVVMVRAAAFKSGLLSSRVTTRSYIFPDHVLTQPANPAGFPTLWDSPCTGYSNCQDVPADYEMDRQVLTNAAAGYAAMSRTGLVSVPTLSIVTDPDLIFGPAKGFYVRREPFNQQPVNAEYILPDGSDGFNIDCGIEIQGQTSPNDQGGTWKSLKLSMRLLFKGEFGATRLRYKLFPESPVDEFDTLIVSAGHNMYWNYMPNDDQRKRAQYVRDQYTSDLQIAAGGLAPHGRFAHVYLNGLYWGLHEIHERPDHSFNASYFGGDKSEYDVMRHDANTVVSGNNQGYNAMLTTARSGLADNAKYAALQQQLDVPWLIDYLIVNFWADNEDWAHKNWYVARRRTTSSPFRFFCWDSEHVLKSPGANQTTLNQAGGPTELFQLLKLNREFRLRFADHVHRHFFNGGIFHTDTNNPVWDPLHPERAVPVAIYLKRIAEIDPAIVCESARWGDVGSTRVNNPCTRNVEWMNELNGLLGKVNTSGHTWNFFPTRTRTVLGQFRSISVYPTIDAPAFSQHGGRVAAGFPLYMTNLNASGTIYFTTNGADPRVYGSGTVAPFARAYSGQPVVLSASASVRARTLVDTNWSALNEALFTVGGLGTPLAITEINYHPPGGDAYEFLELYNSGATPLDLSGHFFEGISYIFPPGSVMPAGGVWVLASGAITNAFPIRYPGVTVSGYYGGSLNNAGEHIAILNPAGQTLLAVDYDDENGWPTSPDGAGDTLEVIEIHGDPDAPANWRSSTILYGTPGLLPWTPSTVRVVLNEIMAENLGAVTNGNTAPDWIELHNPGTVAVALDGWSLTDDGNPRKFVFPAGTTIGAGGYLLVWCDSASTQPGLHTGFGLGRKGDNVFLFDAAGARLDALSFGLQVGNLTVGRMGEDWQLTAPTPGAANATVALAPVTNLSINEWLANAAPGASDWLELFNRSTTSPVALQGLYFSTSNALSQLRSLSFLGPRGYGQLFADGDVGPDHLDFSLPKEGGMIALADPVGASIDQVTYATQAENVSAGRLPDGTANITAFPGSQSPGASNYVVAYAGPALNEVMARNVSAVVGPDGRYADWVELQNPGAAAFDLSGMSLGDGAGTAGQWVFPAGTTIVAGGYLRIWCDGGRPASTSVSANLNTGFSLDGTSGGVYLFNPAGQLINSVEYGFQVPDRSIGRTGGPWRLLANATPGAANSGPATLGSVSNLRINEWMANPVTGDDWFELFNSGSLPVDLAGLYLTDTPTISGITNFQVAPLSFIDGRDWALWIADANPSLGRNHVNFQLNAGGETIRIYSSPSNLVNAADFGFQPEGVSQGRLPDGATNVVSFPDSPSPDAANHLPLTNVVINEVLAHTDAPIEDAIELHNPTAASVNIGGWYLSNSESDPKRYRIPDGTLIQAGGFKVFYEYQFNPNPGVLPSFSLDSAHGDQVCLSVADGAGDLTGQRASVRFGATENGVSLGRVPTSVGVDFTTLASRTFGQDNPSTVAQLRTGTGLPNSGPKIGPVVLNEIMFHPVGGYGTNLTETPDEEYLELLNVTGGAATLFDPLHSTNRWKIGGGVDFTFPPGVSLNAGQPLLVVRFDPVADPAAEAAFRTKHGVPAGVPTFGPWSGRLANEGEWIELFKPDAPQSAGPDAGFVPYVSVERVTYGPVLPWPEGADGGGASLQRSNPPLYGNDPTNWFAAAPTAGRENSASAPQAPTISSQPQDQTVVAGQPVSFSVSATGTEPMFFQWQFDGAEIPGATSATFTISSTQVSDEGIYRVRVTNSLGGILSQPATLTVLVPPAVVSLVPGSQTVAAGSSATIMATATGSTPLRYQWFFNGHEVSGQASAALSLNNVQPDQSGSYQLVVTNLAGTATSGVASLTVLVPPAITGQPQSQTVSEGSNAVFSVSATGDAPLNYQWFIDGNPIGGATSPILMLTGVTLSDSGKSYTVQVSNPVGLVTSSPAVLTVLTRPLLVEVRRSSPAQMQFNIVGQAGRSYFLEVSSDLEDWLTLTETTYVNGQTVTLDTTDGVGRFFRLRAVP